MSFASTAVALAVKYGPDIEALAVMAHNRMPTSPNKAKLDFVLGQCAALFEEFKTAEPQLTKAVSIIVGLARFAGVLPAGVSAPAAPAAAKT
jgi:hypothetical protein